MPEDYLRQSALAHLHLEARATDDPGEASVLMCERAHLGKINLRGDPEPGEFRTAVEGVLGFGLPVEPNTVSAGGGLHLLWLGPDEWLLVAPPGEEAKLLQSLSAVIGEVHAAITDVTDSRAVIGLSGPNVRDVLAKGCSLDLHPRVFGPGRCAQSLLAKASILLHQTDEAPRFDIYVARSYADYLWRWLEDAGTEYGVSVVRG